MSVAKSKYLLYLDTRDLPAERDEEIKAANDSGYGLIIATDRPDRFRYHRVDQIIETPLGDYIQSQRDITSYVEKHKVELAGVICWKDREVELASRLASFFKLRGSSGQSARRVRDKAETRRTLDSLGNVNPKYAVVANRDEFAKALDTLSCPCLLKPAGNSGSRGIFRVLQKPGLDVYDHFCRYNAESQGDMFSYYKDHALLEEEIEGSEHSVAGLVCDGRSYVTGIADKQFERDIFMQYQNIVPSLLKSEIQDAVVEAVLAAVAAIDLTDGGFHADVIVGENNRVYILEIGGRLGGEMINSHLIPLAYDGYSPYQQLLKILANEAATLETDRYRQPTMQAGSRIVRAPRVGRIEQIKGLERVARHPAVRLLMPMKGPGDQILKPRDSFKQYEVAYIIAQCKLEEDIQALLSSLEELVNVELSDEASLVTTV